MDQITLPVSGKSVTFKKLKGLDFIEARRVVPDKDDMFQVGFATLARRCLFDGVQAVYEDILGLEEDDLAALMAGQDSGNVPRGSTPSL